MPLLGSQNYECFPGGGGRLHMLYMYGYIRKTILGKGQPQYIKLYLFIP